jgi:hypothetical protein
MSEGFISRGFRGRKPGAESGRLPPGQYLEHGFPVSPNAGAGTSFMPCRARR